MYYLGLISGTSVDGIDAVIIDTRKRQQLVQCSAHTPYPNTVRQAVDEACKLAHPVAADVAELDITLAELFASAALDVIASSGLGSKDISAIGSHGQTVHHAPHASPPYSLQLGNGQIIANKTGITTVSDFRTADIDAGGEGAPMVPAFHAWLAEGVGEAVVFLNIGGIANITVLDASGAVVAGFDTGPGNTLMDRWIEHCQGKTYDQDGAWAASGKASDALLAAMLADPYFKLQGPKSTGREYFHLPWLQQMLAHSGGGIRPEDVQASLLALSAESISRDIQALQQRPATVYACGGGVHNRVLMSALENKLDGIRLATTAELGLDPDWVEAAAFAWLAQETLAGRPGNVPAVTGANKPVVLGKICNVSRDE